MNAHGMRRTGIALFAAVTAATVLVACSSSGGESSDSSSASSSSAAGSAGSTIKIGLLTSLTGVTAPQFQGLEKDFLARIAVANAAGGVNGHKLEGVVADDQSTPTGALAAVHELVQQDHVIAIDAETNFISSVAPYLHQQNVAVTGCDCEGPQFGLQPYTNMFGTWGSLDPSYPSYTTIGVYEKSVGITRYAALGLGQVPSSTADANNAIKSAEAAGIKGVYLDTSTQLGSDDFSTQALAIKNANADGLYTVMEEDQDFAAFVAVRDAGAKIAHPFLVSGYSYNLLSSAAAKSLDGADFEVYYLPAQLDTPTTRQVVAALRKYAGYTADEFYGYDILGWLGANLIITGLQAAGTDPTTASLITAIHGLKDYDGGGLLPATVSFALNKFGNGDPAGAGGCDYVLRLQGDKFIVSYDGKPVCGTEIPNSAGKQASLNG